MFDLNPIFMVYKCTRDYFSNENGIIKIVPSLGIALFGVSSILHISPYTLWVVWGGGGGTRQITHDHKDHKPIYPTTPFNH
jgi:hypothetical protein